MRVREKMKRNIALAVTVLTALAVSACGGQNQAGGASEGESPRYETALDVLNAVLEVYEEDERFAIAGGDQEHAVMDAPGAFDVSKTEELDLSLGLPQSQVSAIDDAASMVHMMNSNTFTGAAYHLKADADVETFVNDIKDNIGSRQWMCGFPDTLLIIDAGDSYVITAYGEAEIMETFKTHALSALDGASVLVEEPIL